MSLKLRSIKDGLIQSKRATRSCNFWYRSVISLDFGNPVVVSSHDCLSFKFFGGGRRTRTSEPFKELIYSQPQLPTMRYPHYFTYTYSNPNCFVVGIVCKCNDALTYSQDVVFCRLGSLIPTLYAHLQLCGTPLF